MKRARVWFVVLGGGLLAASVIGWIVYDKLFREEFPVFASDSDHFKYGSIGNDGENGLPYLVWRALPSICPDLLPGAGGYASLGFVWEPGHGADDAPVGISRARVGFERAAINCAFCHHTVMRTNASSPPIVYPAGPSNIIDVQGYQRFLSNCAADRRFAPDVLLPAIEKSASLSLVDGLLYRFLIIPQTQKALLKQKTQLAWTEKRPNWGAGRIDPFNPVKFGMLHLADDGTIGNSDMQAVWGLDARDAIRPNAPLHWDGLNTSIHEVMVSSALGDGATGKSFNFPSIARMERYLRTLHPPASPYKPDTVLVERGAAVFAENCSECHGKDGARTLTVVPLAEIGTDRHRSDMWTVQARDAYQNYREGYDFGFKSFQKVEGYVAEPLDGVWLTGPYLHNGSVPTIADLLKPVAERPMAFVRGTTVLDSDKIGFLAEPCIPGQKIDSGYCFDTKEMGNAPSGHIYGTRLSPQDKDALIAYLKTL
jgi:hypothetical protein